MPLSVYDRCGRESRTELHVLFCFVGVQDFGVRGLQFDAAKTVVEFFQEGLVLTEGLDELGTTIELHLLSFDDTQVALIIFVANPGTGGTDELGDDGEL